MNQHFVPKFYLKNFSENNKQIFVYDKAIHKSFSTSISSVASQDSFYDRSNNKSIESEIGKTEGKTSIALKNLIDSILINQFSKIQNDQKEIIIEFIWLQMIRTKESRIDFGSIIPYLHSKLTNTPFQTDANEIFKQIEIKDKQIEFVHTFKANPLALDTFRDRNFIIVKNETHVDFITSDDPVVRYLHWDVNPKFYEIFLPITSRVGIWIVPKNVWQVIDDVDRHLYSLLDHHNILFYNYNQVYQSTRQIFSSTDNFDYVRQLFKTETNFGNTNKKRYE